MSQLYQLYVYPRGSRRICCFRSFGGDLTQRDLDLFMEAIREEVDAEAVTLYDLTVPITNVLPFIFALATAAAQTPRPRRTVIIAPPVLRRVVGFVASMLNRPHSIVATRTEGWAAAESAVYGDDEAVEKAILAAQGSA